ncbi:cupin domain-containing protein [Sphingomonas sp. CFBP 13728]|uniref:cupin domain-containing protein n=1 Tax=Sphingomonas sp. CFBP 13728 TaxID=2775294 RepID=UPI00177CA34D|nr:cupin domain-containing protein [Sphingomonas sp. CFBP 13728]MBD8617975.1 cupin domain-containing protein [Sphingomonas sp. CFBP 13728]
MRPLLAVVLAIGATSSLPAQTASDPTSFAGSADVRARIVALEKTMKPGQGFAMAPLVQADGTSAALEYWKAPGKPAVHPDEAEYATVMAGSGTLVSGGTLVAPKLRFPGLVEGDRIEGGTTRKLAVGDVFLIPAGTPHWFGINGKLVMLGTKIKPSGQRKPSQ